MKPVFAILLLLSFLVQWVLKPELHAEADTCWMSGDAGELEPEKEEKKEYSHPSAPCHQGCFSLAPNRLPADQAAPLPAPPRAIPLPPPNPLG